ncbi:MAG: DUF507 family protein [Deltaproteobacteria bacterium]|nr:DUF507 family protein [Deltaproteobacteria bacterium]
MKYSKDRIRKLSRMIVETLKQQDACSYLVGENIIRESVDQIIKSYFSIEDEVHEIVIKKIGQMKKLVPGSTEWEVTYNKLFEMEINRKIL